MRKPGDVPGDGWTLCVPIPGLIPEPDLGLLAEIAAPALLLLLTTADEATISLHSDQRGVCISLPGFLDRDHARCVEQTLLAMIGTLMKGLADEGVPQALLRCSELVSSGDRGSVSVPTHRAGALVLRAGRMTPVATCDGKDPARVVPVQQAATVLFLYAESTLRKAVTTQEFEVLRAALLGELPLPIDILAPPQRVPQKIFKQDDGGFDYPEYEKHPEPELDLEPEPEPEPEAEPEPEPEAEEKCCDHALLPPLAYSLPTFAARDYDDIDAKLDKLKEAGFCVLSLTPTYRVTTRLMNFVYDNKRLRGVVQIDDQVTPSKQVLTNVVRKAIRRGFHVRLEPHVDADIVLAGNQEYYWRAQLMIDPQPAGPYFSLVVQRSLEIFEAVKDELLGGVPDCHPCFWLTIGSELEMSTVALPDSWLAALTQARRERTRMGLDGRLALIHKVNHDFNAAQTLPGGQTRTRMDYWIDFANGHNREINATAPLLTSAAQLPKIGRYLGQLDHIGISFYPELTGPERPPPERIPGEQWRTDPTPARVSRIASLMARRFDGMLHRPFQGLGRVLELSECGIGSPNPSIPWEASNPRSMDTAEGRNVRLHYIRALLEYLRNNKQRFTSPNGCLEYSPVTFWTVMQFDWLGVSAGGRRFRHPDVIDEVRRYNRETFDD